jgi:hypothetical protein
MLLLTQSRINKNSARYANTNIHDSAPFLTSNLNRINENSSMCVNANIHDSVSYVALNSSRDKENLAHCANPYASSTWTVPYHRPYPLFSDYIKTPNGWGYMFFMNSLVNIYSRTVMEYISLYLSHMGDARIEDPMKVQNFLLLLTGTAF